MVYRLNILSQHITALCEDVLLAVNGTSYLDNIKNILDNCIKDNQRVLGICKYSIPTPKTDWCYSFTINVYFDCFNERVKIEFYNTNTKNISDHPSFNVRLLTPKLIVSSVPLCIPIEGIIYCNNYNKILYIDSFEALLQFRPSIYDIFIQWVDKLRKDERNHFFAFFEKLSEEEKHQIRIINHLWSDDHDEMIQNLNEAVPYAIDEVNSNFVNRVVVRDNELMCLLKKRLPQYVMVLNYADNIPPLSRKEWIRRAIFMINKEFSFFADKSKYINESIALFMKEFMCSKAIIMEICRDELGKSEFESLRNHLSYPDI